MSDKTLSRILNAAVSVAETKGYNCLTRIDVATKAQCSEALVSHYLGTVKELREVTLRYAIACNLAGVIAQGLALKDPITSNIPVESKRRAAQTLLED